jgi:hypothetical protein
MYDAMYFFSFIFYRLCAWVDLQKTRMILACLHRRPVYRLVLICSERKVLLVGYNTGDSYKS